MKKTIRLTLLAGVAAVSWAATAQAQVPFDDFSKAFIQDGVPQRLDEYAKKGGDELKKYIDHYSLDEEYNMAFCRMLARGMPDPKVGFERCDRVIRWRIEATCEWLAKGGYEQPEALQCKKA
jgi:hypothetical protein